MERRLIPQGKGGYTIYLPKKWVDRKGLKGGDVINVTEKDTALIIGSPAKGKEEATVEITDENRKDLKNILTHLYRRGFDSIEIANINANLLKEIKDIASNLLLGFEITEKSSSRCKIENISEPKEAKYDVLLRRIFLIIKETQNIITNDFESNDLKSIKEIEDFRKQQDKYILFCRRTLTKEMYVRDPVLGWELLTFLMHIEHAYYYLYKYAAENNVRQDKAIDDMLKQLKDYFDLFYNSHYKSDIKYVHKINNLKNKLQLGKCLELIEKSKGKNAVVFSYIRELFRLMQVGTSPILSEILQKSDYSI